MQLKHKLILFLVVIIFIMVANYGGYFSQFCMDNKEFYKRAINGKVSDIKIANDKMRETNRITVLIKDSSKYISYTYSRPQADIVSILIGDSLAKNSSTFKADLFRNDNLIISFNEDDLCYYCK